MMNKINPVNSNSESVSSLYASVLSKIGGSVPETGKSADPQNVASISTCDKVDFDAVEQFEEEKPSNIEALKKSLSSAQGFESGVQPSFSLSSLNGSPEGLEKGIQPAGVFKA